MKNVEKVISDRIFKIESNNLRVINYLKIDNGLYIVNCICNKCGYSFNDVDRNLSHKFKCRYCILIERSKLIKEGIVKIVKIENHGIGNILLLECKNGHIYKQDRRNLLANKGCNECYLENKKLPKLKILEMFKKTHGDYYVYDLCNFKNIHTKIKITCKKNHIFYQKISNHLQGKGCPICRESLGERTIKTFLEKNNINYQKQKTFDGCFYVNKLKFDFYLPENNVCVEYDGIQHFKPIKQFGGEKEFLKTQARDVIKNEYCNKNGIYLIRISYLDNIQEKLSHINKLIVL
jgi:hypothetical protein